MLTSPSKRFLDEIVCAARGSALSLAQLKEVEALTGLKLLAKIIHTSGDIDLKTSLVNLEKSDFFTKEIDAVLLEGLCDIAIHSAKDMPEKIDRDLEIVAVTKGVDPSDCLVFRKGESLEQLPRGARIGTSSLRREKNILALRSDLQIVDIRGDVLARLTLLDSGKIDALVVAVAALIRLGLKERVGMKLEGERAAFQGQLAVVARRGDIAMQRLFAAIDTREILYLGLELSEDERVYIHRPAIKVIPLEASVSSNEQALIFTSKNGVRFFAALGGLFKDKKIVAVGTKTAAEIEKLGFKVDFVAKEECQEGVLAILKELKELSFFWPRSKKARSFLEEETKRLGISLRAVDIYDVEPISIGHVNFNRIKEIIFTSPSTVDSFFSQFKAVPKNIKCMPIGHITARQINLKYNKIE